MATIDHIENLYYHCTEFITYNILVKFQRIWIMVAKENRCYRLFWAPLLWAKRGQDDGNFKKVFHKIFQILF